MLHEILSMIGRMLKGGGDLERRGASRAFAEGNKSVRKCEEGDETVGA